MTKIGNKIFVAVLFFLTACTSQVNMVTPATGLKIASIHQQQIKKQGLFIKKSPTTQAKMSIQSQPGRPGFYQARVSLNLPKPQTTSTDSFKTQALPLNLIQFVKVEITGVGIATPLWADGADGAGLVANIGGNVTLTVSNVPYGKARVATLTAYDVAKVAIPGATIKSTFHTQNPVENLEMSFRSTPNGDAVSQMFGSTANDHTATTMDLSALETLVDAITGQGGTYPTYTYSQAHPSLVNTAQLATDLLGNGGNPGALTAATYRINPAQVDVTLAGLISSDTATVQVTDPASNILGGATNGLVSIPGATPGNWITQATAVGYTTSGTPATVTTAGNTVNVGTITFTWANTPNISSLAPASGIIGASININGTDFHPTTAGNVVKFNGVTATVTAATPTQLTVTVPAGATDGNVSVQVGTKLSNTSAFNIDDPPNISSVTPSVNPVSGLSYPVEIVAVATDDITTLVDASYSWSCTAFCGDGSFNRTDSNTVVWTSPTTPQGGASVIQVSVTDGVNTPVNSTANITITNNNGDVIFTSSLGNLPKITSLSAPSAQVGATISINGTNFHAAANGNIVKFGSIVVPTSDITVISANQLDVKVPYEASGGPVNIVVSTGTQTSNAQSFTVLPKLDSINPTSGLNSTTVPVEIWGSGFQTGATLDIGVTGATGIVIQSPNRITANVPAGLVGGTHDVKVTNADLNLDTLSSAWTSIVATVGFVGSAGSSGSSDGTGGAAQFNKPFAVAVDSLGNIFVADNVNHTIRKVTPAGVVSTFAGSAGNSGNADGTGGTARFESPGGIAVDASDNIYVADTQNHTIRKITPGGVVTTIAGDPGNSGDSDGTGATANFDSPANLDVDSNGDIFVADTLNFTIRKVTPAGVVTTFAGSAGNAGIADGTGGTARFDKPNDLAFDASDNMYVADLENHTIRKITPAGVVTTFAGSAGNSGSADGIGASARFLKPSGVGVDNLSGQIVITEIDNHTIRKITPGAVVTTLAGSAGNSGYAEGAGATARFNKPNDVDVFNGQVYIADQDNHMIRKLVL